MNADDHLDNTSNNRAVYSASSSMPVTPYTTNSTLDQSMVGQSFPNPTPDSLSKTSNQSGSLSTNSSKTSNKCVSLIIILMIIAFAGIVFAVFELYQNISLQNEIQNLKATIESGNTETSTQNGMTSTGAVSDILELTFIDEAIPPSSYEVRVNYASKELSVDEYHSCSAVDCDGSESSATITLTDDEILRIKTITSNPDYDEQSLALALSSLVAGDRVVSTNKDYSWEIYQEYDADNDGIVTSREFANNWLDSIISGE